MNIKIEADYCELKVGLSTFIFIAKLCEKETQN